jgi:D-alanyl-D-alanine dipeptidase
MPILLSDPRVAAIEVIECGEPIVRLDPRLGPGVVVRRSVAGRVTAAAARLPRGIRLRVVEGYRSAAAQRAIIATYTRTLRAAHPGLEPAEVARLASRFVAPLEVAPHVAGAAIDVTLVDAAGRELDLGTPIDATPEETDGRCYTDAPDLPLAARRHRRILGEVLAAEGFVNYPTEWWHWSHGDRYWALVTGAPAAVFGPVDLVHPIPAAGAA